MHLFGFMKLPGFLLLTLGEIFLLLLQVFDHALLLTEFSFEILNLFLEEFCIIDGSSQVSLVRG